MTRLHPAIPLSARALALAPLLALAQPADARVTELFTISNYQASQGGTNISGITAVSGSFTTGTTAADDTSMVTVKEFGQGLTDMASYTFTGRENGPGWSVQSAFTDDTDFKATFRINPFGPGPVSNNVSVSLQDFIDGGSGTVTITETPVSAPEPAAWALMLAGLGVMGGALRARGRAAPGVVG